MTEPTDPNVTAARDPSGSADEAAPHASGKPKFGPPADPKEVGTLGPYRVVKRLGAGGMGAVYLAVDTRLDRRLALKVMLPAFAADREAKERFLREAKSAAKISHDNVVTVFEADERDGVPYIAMQFLQGYPLDDYLRTKGGPPLAHVVRIAREAALGLAAAHELGLVHRDVKPGNLWLEAPNGRVKVLDFGLAKPVGAEIELTSTGAVVGTPAYMSPEQARGSKVDARTDLFSLGVMLYRLCAGKLPFEGASVMAVLMALGTEEPAPVRDLNPNVPEALAALIHQLLAKKPEHRPQTAAEVARRLRGVLDGILNPGGPAVASPSSADVSASRPVVVHALPVPPNVTPMHVTAAPVSAFAGLGDDADEATQAEPADEPEPGRRAAAREPKTGGKGALIGAAAAALLAVGAAVGVFVLKGKKDEPVADRKPDAPPPAAAPKKGKDAPKPVSPEHAAAEWVLSVGGEVRFPRPGGLAHAAAAKELPAEGLVVTHVEFPRAKHVGDAALERLNGLSRLGQLGAHNTAVTDAGLAHVARHPHLSWLGLGYTTVSDAGLEHLRGLRELDTLLLEGTRVGDAGLAGLAALDRLARLDVRDTKVTAAGVEKLSKALPECKIEWDGGVIEPKKKP